jgi:hypothetical protein
MSQDNKTIVNFGYKNGWPENSGCHTVVRVCKNIGHVRTSFQVSKSITEYQCNICGYKYRIDLGD